MVDLVRRVCGRELAAYASLAVRNDGIREGDDQNTAMKEVFGELLCQDGVTDDDWSDWVVVVTGDGEARPRHASSKAVSVFPEPVEEILDVVGLKEELVDGSGSSGNERRCESVREKVRSRSVSEQ